MASLYDLDGRIVYSLRGEQVDGAFTFNKDGYIIEEKWWNGQVGRSEADVFATKVKRKGRNTLGLFAFMAGFTNDFLDFYSTASPFTTMDAMELLVALDQHLRFDNVPRQKKRHLDERGSCYCPVN